MSKKTRPYEEIAKECGLSEKAEPKTILELIALHDAWKRTFHRGAMGNRNDYNLARDTRHYFEEELWIPAKGLVEELKKVAYSFPLREDSHGSDFEIYRITDIDKFKRRFEKVLARLGEKEKS